MIKSGLFCISLIYTVFVVNSVILNEDNGYKIVVAINKDVPENTEIVTQLQEALTAASAYLDQTTRNHHFIIQEVIIVVPETWETDPEWESSSLTFREADIRVDSPHPSMGNKPYTFQPGLCGDEGRYIHLTPDFVLDSEGSRDFYYGDVGRLLVHEFAHMRYGVFDEYGSKGSSQHPVYYIDEDSSLKPTACSHEIEGRFMNMDQEQVCFYNEENINPLSEDCAFIVDVAENYATASVMFAQYLDEVTEFCETDPNDPKLRHNADAPNKQNKMCNGRGTWDIIREHPDVMYSTPNQGRDTTPTFQVVQRSTTTDSGDRVCGRRFVFVLDVSGSMTSNNRYFKLRQMADKIIRDILPVGTEVGIVVFSGIARLWADMRFLTSESDRQMLAEGLPTINEFTGNTAIGEGLLRGIELLEENSQSAAGGRIFLITDGVENVEPYVNSTLTEIVKKGVVVHTLAYSAAAAHILQELSDQTGGQYSYFDEDEESTQLEAAAQRLLEDVSICDSGDDSVEIDRHAAVLDSSTTSYERSVLIDSTVGNNTLFVFTLSNGATTRVSIEDPDGDVYDETSSIFNKDETLNIIRFTFPEAKQGAWKYTLERGSTTTESVVAVVKSHPRTDGILPFEVESWLGKTTFNFGNEQEGLAIFSYVHQGYSPIIMAEVNMILSSTTLTTEKVLMDNGIFPDNTADDGVYTSYVVGFSSNSRHSLDVTVKSVDGQTAIIRAGTALTAKAPVIYPNRTTPVVFEPVEPFTRTSSAGAVDVEGFDPNLDQLDPSRVTDLEVRISDRGSRQVTLTWTAPGDDLDEGTVDRYDIRIADSFEGLRQNFSDCYEILDTDIKSGNNTPVPAGNQQNMTMALPGHMGRDSYVFGLKAIDESNRSSDLSNLKAITFAKITIPGSLKVPEENGETNPPMMLIIIAACISCFVVLVVIAILISFFVCGKKQEKTHN